MSAPVKIVAILAPRPGKASELEALLKGLAAASRAEPGNRLWDVWREQEAPRRFVLNELYIDKAAAKAHRATPHFKTYLERIGDLADRTALTLDPADVAQEEEML